MLISCSDTAFKSHEVALSQIWKRQDYIYVSIYGVYFKYFSFLSAGGLMATQLILFSSDFLLHMSVIK